MFRSRGPSIATSICARSIDSKPYRGPLSPRGLWKNSCFRRVSEDSTDRARRKKRVRLVKAAEPLIPDGYRASLFARNRRRSRPRITPRQRRHPGRAGVDQRDLACPTVSHFHRFTARDHDCIRLIEEQSVLHDVGECGDRCYDFGRPWYLVQGRVHPYRLDVCQQAIGPAGAPAPSSQNPARSRVCSVKASPMRVAS